MDGSARSAEPDTTEQPPRLAEDRQKKIEDSFGLLATRLNDFITLSTNKIEEMRLHTKDNGFFRHQFCFFCGD
jgi:hypothetical protein